MSLPQNIKDKQIVFLDILISSFIIISGILLYYVLPNENIMRLGRTGEVTCNTLTSNCNLVGSYLNNYELLNYLLIFSIIYVLVINLIYIIFFKDFFRIKYLLLSSFSTLLFWGVMALFTLGAGLGGTSHWNFWQFSILYGSFYATFLIYPITHFYLIYHFSKKN